MDRTRLSASQVLRWLRQDKQAGPGGGDRIWKAARAAGLRTRPALGDGRWLRIGSADLEVSPEDGEPPQQAIWRGLARAHGLDVGVLQAFNHRKRRGGRAQPWTAPRLPELRAGRQVFLPSADEVLLALCARWEGGHAKRAMERMIEAERGHRLRLFRAAVARASGRLGRAYSNEGISGMFLSPNPALEGAADRPGRVERIDGRKEYQIRWGADFWKCSVYLQDVVYQAGFVPHMSANDHYLVAGQVHRSPCFRELPLAAAAPGDVWQRWGGDGVEQSHTGVLASFVEVRSLPPQPDQPGPLEVWSFSLLGAEREGAGVSRREQIVRKGSNETVEGKRIRFFAPSRERASA